VGDPDPDFDDCSSSPTLHLVGRNIGDLLNAKKISWGFFEAGIRPTLVTPGRAQCGLAHKGADGKEKKDYIPHHEPFQYWQQTSNPHHLPPSAVLKIGHDDQANHQYDVEDFWLAAKAGAVPAVSFLKAPAYQDGHAGYSDPLSEQTFLVETMNRLQALPQWKDMAVIITYDDSDGWYDHVMPPIIRRSHIKGVDALLGDEGCGASKNGDDQGRCGYGPRLPFLLISPYARENFVDHSVIDQASVARFIEDNWGLGRIGAGSFDEDAGSLLAMFDFSKRRTDKLLLDPSTGRKAPPLPPKKKR
jgi:phospholipase C